MDSKLDIINKVKEIVGRYEVIDELSEYECLESLLIADLSKVQIAMELERVYDIEFDLSMISSFKTVGDLVSFIEREKSQEDYV